MKPTFPERLSSRSATPIFRELPAQPAGKSALTDGNVLPQEFELPRNALWSFNPHTGLVVRCLVGELWITQSGDARDVVLQAGETFEPAPKGQVVVQALTDARVFIPRL
jgi:hypothetical protein